jgi:hypothetical protein
MVISSSVNPREIEIAGTRDEFIQFATLLAERDGRLQCEVPSMSAAPYSEFLKNVEWRRLSTGKVEFEVSDGYCLQISGDSESLSRLALSISDFAAEGADDEHAHIEYFEGHFFLSPTSVPAVIRFADD